MATQAEIMTRLEVHTDKKLLKLVTKEGKEKTFAYQAGILLWMEKKEKNCINGYKVKSA